ncbi:MAG: hypothetical protein ACREFE_20485, partial [Limisphaerales bacterium]
LHVRKETFKNATDANHLHSPYHHIVQHGLDHLLDRARLIGAHTGSWAEAMTRARGPIAVRVLHGLISLAEKHPVKALEDAAQTALHHGAGRLRDVRLLAGSGCANSTTGFFGNASAHPQFGKLPRLRSRLFCSQH